MAATIVGGLTFSMLVTLVLVPTLYSLVHSRRRGNGNKPRPRRSAAMKAVWILHDIVLTDEIQASDEMASWAVALETDDRRGPEAARGWTPMSGPEQIPARSWWWTTRWLRA